MPDGALRVPITCPECAREYLSELPLAAVADALAAGQTIRLFAKCHARSWDANVVEREQLREYLEAACVSREGLQHC
jgi:hypothetical protein